MDYPCYNCFSHSIDCYKTCDAYLRYLKQSGREAEIEKLENNLNKPILTTINTTTPELSTAEKLLLLAKNYDGVRLEGLSIKQITLISNPNYQIVYWDNFESVEEAINAAYNWAVKEVQE